MKKQEFRNMRRGLGTYKITFNIPTSESGVPEGEEEEEETENLFEKILKENFPSLVKEINIKSRKLRESQRNWTQGGTHQGTS